MGADDMRAPGELSFGEALRELETIVAELESGRLELEESLERYERGVGLLKALRERLSDAEQKVRVLMGELEEDSETDGDDVRGE